MTAERSPVINILRDWMMRNPQVPEPAMVVVVAPDTWRWMQAEFGHTREELTQVEILHRQRFDGLPVLIDPDAPLGYLEVMPTEEYARRYPAPTLESPAP